MVKTMRVSAGTKILRAPYRVASESGRLRVARFSVDIHAPARSETGGSPMAPRVNRVVRKSAPARHSKPIMMCEEIGCDQPASAHCSDCRMLVCEAHRTNYDEDEDHGLEAMCIQCNYGCKSQLCGRCGIGLAQKYWSDVDFEVLHLVCPTCRTRERMDREVIRGT